MSTEPLNIVALPGNEAVTKAEALCLDALSSIDREYATHSPATAGHTLGNALQAALGVSCPDLASRVRDHAERLGIGLVDAQEADG